MPPRTDLRTVLIVGSGPIVIGQACEFDYSGAQACKALREAGYRVVLVNSNPATIMTDPDFADATYVEPITAESVGAVIARERPDALLPTLGGQTALNVARELALDGTLDAHGVELIGARLATIDVAEDRRAFGEAMARIGLDTARSGIAESVEQAVALAERFGLPCLLRASYTLGGAGSGIARSAEDVVAMARTALAESPVGRLQVDEWLEGWKEYELEVMRDRADTCVVVCSIENVDAMGVHTGDSVTVAPAMTLTDPELQRMRDAAFAVMREVGVETGGSNVQFAVCPDTGRQVVVEMNPRVSRSSALASKATGFPIAKIAALLAVGCRLDELPNDITGETVAAFEPTIDYVVTKIPRFHFSKFPGADATLTTSMKSVGEVMAIGRTFTESLGKALASLEDGTVGLTGEPAGAEPDAAEVDDDALAARLAAPHSHRLLDADAALSRGWPPERVAELTGYDPWFVDRLAHVGEVRRRVHAGWGEPEEADALGEAKRVGLSDAAIARTVGSDEQMVRTSRRRGLVEPVHKTVDTCAGEFPARTPYHYSAYEHASEVADATADRVLILGSGPNRIGQGIEFDYCCVHACFALREAGFETVMVNCNPETVSTDYDTADRLYFEPLTLEHVLAVHDAEARAAGDPSKVAAMVQLGGQTPLRLARDLAAHGVRILGTSPDAIDAAEDRGRFGALLRELGIPQPDGDVAADPDEALAIAGRIGFPVLVRPSYVLGGQSMEIVYDAAAMRTWLAAHAAEGPVLVDKFLEGAIEVDVDAVADGREVLVGGVLEHIEEAGVHSGDSACVLPPMTLGRDHLRRIRDHAAAIAEAVGVRGLLNLQLAVRDEVIHVIEANPRASRTVPFVSKATGVPLAKLAARVMAGAELADLRAEGLAPDAEALADPGHVAVKEAVMPFDRFPGVDSRLGPEMRSTGEVMGLADGFGAAFAKAQAGTPATVLPTAGTVFASIANRDKRAVGFPLKRLADMGFTVLATDGTARALAGLGIACRVVPKVSETAPGGPAEGDDDVVDLIEAGEVDLVLNTPRGSGPRADGFEIRAAATSAGVPCVTTLSGILAAVQGIEALRDGPLAVSSLQERHAAMRGAAGEERR